MIEAVDRNSHTGTTELAVDTAGAAAADAAGEDIYKPVIVDNDSSLMVPVAFTETMRQI